VDGRLTLFTATASYTLKLEHVTIAQKTDSPLRPPVASTPLFFAAPTTPIYGAWLDFDSESGSPSACARSPYILPDHVPYQNPDANDELAHAQSRAIAALKAGAPVAQLLDRRVEGEPPCSVPYRQSRLVKPAIPDYPASARGQSSTGIALVLVDLDGTGHIRELGILRSSGNTALDASALSGAKLSTYAPEVFRCRPTPGTFVYEAKSTGTF